MEKDYSTIDKHGKLIWDYMLMHQELKKSDAIIALGSNDIRVAERAFELYKEGLAPFIICTGGVGHTGDINISNFGGLSEAEKYKELLLKLGMDSSDIILETKAENTGQNVLNVRSLLQEMRLKWNNFIVVGKPWNERRAYATFKKQWPEANICMSSPVMSYEDYMNSKDVSKEVFLNVMIGDFQRIKEYPKLGFQIEQEIPDNVWYSFQELVKLGYDKYLIK